MSAGRAKVAALAGALAASAASASLAHAQDVTGAVQLDQYRPAASVDDGFVVSRPDDRGHMRFGVRLDVDYALNPLVVEGVAGSSDTERGALVEHSLRAHVGGSLGLFDRVVVFAGLPFDLVQSGQSIEGLPAGGGAGLGDLWLGVRGRIWGEPGEVFALGAQLTATLPTAAAASPSQRYAGESGLTLTPSLLAEVRPVSMLRATGNLGVRFRTADPTGLVNLRVGHELTWALGVTVDAVRDVLAVYVEGFGAAVFDGLSTDASRVAAPIEALAGARVTALPGLDVGVALGTGLTRGVGAPDVRGVLTLGYAERPIRDAVDGDRDGDGVLDRADGCPDVAEDRDGWQDEDGCPDLDDDADGIPDATDGCPRAPEDRDGDRDEDGCPEDGADRDGDGVLDPTDACVDVPEDRDGWQDEDGCPDLDDDADGIPDVGDGCPRQAETRNGYLDADGCPDVTPGEVELTDLTAHIYFGHDSAQPTGESRGAIADAARLIVAHPEWLHIVVEGHASVTGDEDYNEELSQRRAERVRSMLVTLGVAADRLEVVAYGHSRAEVEGDSEEAHSANRRVTFTVTARAER